MQCLDWGLSRAHQPSKHRLNKLFLTLSRSLFLSFVLVPLSYLSISLSPCLVSTDLSRGLCFLTIISSHKHIQETHTSTRGGVSFILYRTAEMSTGHVPVKSSLSVPQFPTNTHSSVTGFTVHSHLYTGGQKRVTEQEMRRGGKMNEEE